MADESKPDAAPEEKPSPAPSHSSDRLAPYRWPFVVVIITLFALIAYVFTVNKSKEVYDDALERTGRGLDRAAKAAVDIAERFQRGIITESFTADIPKLEGTGMGNLELATSESSETFSRTDMKTIAWDYVYLGTTTTEIKVPVTYRYHLRLADEWRLDVSNQTCVVIAPSIRPSQPPAIHTDRMEKKSDRGWARLNVGEQMQELEQSITPTVRRYAGDPRHMNYVREECRKTVAEFVKAWLLKEDHWRKDRFSSIKVVFADEVPRIDMATVEPTIRIED